LNEQSLARLFGWRQAFDHPVTLYVSIGLAAVLAVVPLLVAALSATGRVDARLRSELFKRYLSWLVLVPLIMVPVLLGAAWTMVAVGLLGLACFGEFARVTALVREKTLCLVAVLGIFGLTLASLDHWYRLFVALFPLTSGLIAIAAILPDRPAGYLQRVALAVLGFNLFGTCLLHFAYLANSADYRPLILMVILCVELNDVFAFVVGKSLGRRKLAPRTSPNKTVAGAVGALVLTTLLAGVLGRLVFVGTPLAAWYHLVAIGFLISVLGQFGDLVLSSVKRDLGIKDMGSSIPGHGGLLDRFDSLILVAPGVFHYVNYFAGVGTGENTRIFTGG
jgi:phosphatidate cytidylyltransferase